jgi:heme/copper-type cytochrome/quinol oxidase subunit 1
MYGVDFATLLIAVPTGIANIPMISYILRRIYKSDTTNVLLMRIRIHIHNRRIKWCCISHRFIRYRIPEIYYLVAHLHYVSGMGAVFRWMILLNTKNVRIKS